jgi:hypothetical protein
VVYEKRERENILNEGPKFSDIWIYEYGKFWNYCVNPVVHGSGL